MRILVLAPHPFFQNRGTPIDVLLVLRVLSERKNTKTDLLVYNEGDDIDLPQLNIYRTPNFWFTQNIRPGFSLRKLICDFFLFIKAWSLILQNKYDLIHAGEEAVFMAIFFKLLHGIPYAYDLDSSVAQQLIEKKPALRKFSKMFNWLEAKAIQGSMVNLPVCNALAELCHKNHSSKTVTIYDISQLRNPHAIQTGKLKLELGIENLVLLYCGNLETYQGIDLLLESFQLVCQQTDKIDLVIIGGDDEDIQHYEEKASKLNIKDKTHLLGPKPFDKLDEYLAEADILVAPRIKGINTPMKVFPFLHSGKPVLLTDLYTHNQIFSNNEAYLAPANPNGFSKGILDLVENEDLRKRLGENGRKFVEKNHTYSAHQKRLHCVYDWIETKITGASTSLFQSN
jgi:glycosyltransferase involved in cell wall biosynthesis